MTQPSMFSDSMLLTEAEARLARLAPLLEGPDQQALEVVHGRLAELEAENRTLKAKLAHFTGASR